MITKGTVKARYGKYASDRDMYLKRARTCAGVTIPTLVPPDENGSSTTYTTPYQGLGARGVNNLASKLLLALFPPNTPFFKYSIDDFALEDLTKQEGLRSEVESALNSIERAVQAEVENTAVRVKVFEGLKQLIVAGNVLLYMPKDDSKLRVFKLNNYVIKRAPDGRVLEIIALETTTPLALSAEIREACKVDTTTGDGSPKPVEIYTMIERADDRWNVWQEINGYVVPNSEGHHRLDKSQWIPLRMIAVDGEDYGRSYVEEYVGDLISLEGLSRSIVEGAAAAARVLFFVNPNGVTKIKDVTDAPNGAARAGNAEDVSTLQLEKFADFRVARETMDTISERLSFAFMLNSAVQRNGERVTAEEIRYMAGELEDALGGIYSVLSQEFQLPYVNLLIDQMAAKKRIPKLPKEAVNPVITTGLEALGRGHDLNKLVVLADSIYKLGPEAINEWLNTGDYIARTATALGIDAKGLVNSKEDVDAKRQLKQIMDILQRVAPQLLQQIQGGQPNGTSTPQTQ